MSVVKVYALLALLASVPWQGVAFHNHTMTRYVPLGNTGIMVLQRRHVPICVHLDWRIRRMIRSAPGAILA